MEYFEEFKEFLELHNLEPPIGCSKEEVCELEKSIGYSLPEAYKNYLYLAGKDYDGVMVGTDCFFDDVVSNNNYLLELLKENKLSTDSLPDSYLTFFSHQGYMMAWFQLPTEEDDPVCYHYFEGTTKEPQEYGTFTEFMNTDLIGNAKLRAENRKFEKNKKWWKFWQ